MPIKNRLWPDHLCIQGTDSHQKVHETIHHLTLEITEGTIRGQSDRVSLGPWGPFLGMTVVATGF